MLRMVGLALALALAPVAVAARETGAAAQGGNPVLATVPLTASTRTGVHHYTVEMAVTEDQQAKGLMFRRHMDRAHGMLFPMNPPRPAVFWMENTLIPLDLVFIGADGRVLNVAAHAKRLSRDHIPSTGDAAAVLELTDGEAARAGLQAGDRVRWGR